LPLGHRNASGKPRAIRQSCTIGAGDKAGTLRLETDNGECSSNGHRHCGTNMSDVSMTRITGVSLATSHNPALT